MIRAKDASGVVVARAIFPALRVSELTKVEVACPVRNMPLSKVASGVTAELIDLLTLRSELATLVEFIVMTWPIERINDVTGVVTA